MSRMDWGRLMDDCPDWEELTFDELRRRYWAYDIDTVRTARALVHLRRIQSALLHPVTYLLDKLAGIPHRARVLARQAPDRIRCRLGRHKERSFVAGNWEHTYCLRGTCRKRGFLRARPLYTTQQLEQILGIELQPFQRHFDEIERTTTHV